MNMNRIGFHYFPDCQHYQQSDLDAWLPRLKDLGAGWLVLDTPVARALPENFLQRLLEADIEPILRCQFSPVSPPSLEEFSLLLGVYARWGIKYIVLFDRPNLRRTWSGASWAQSDLVERFLDLFLPWGEACSKAGLTPIFPPLEPGGDYWDTSFLKAALEGMSRRGHQSLLDTLVVGAYAWANDQPLDYGIGGPERWPGAQPYITPTGEQDQRGFRIFDWYQAIIESVLLESRLIFLFGLGNPGDSEGTLQIARLLAGEEIEGVAATPDAVLGGAFWLLSAPEGSEHAPRAWYPPNGEAAPVVEAMLQWQASNPKNASPTPGESRPISHYVLLPTYDWGIPDYPLDALRPYIKSHKPTLGFSLEEAAKARRVTVIGSEGVYPEEVLRQLRSNGCIVERIDATADGTTLASRLTRLS
ncbi:MAG: hypothetical protein FJ010_14250 [Chloroflexi bacterium]|nr:hypothetical protein [Chloroflexota bacterium]